MRCAFQRKLGLVSSTLVVVVVVVAKTLVVCIRHNCRVGLLIVRRICQHIGKIACYPIKDCPKECKGSIESVIDPVDMLSSNLFVFLVFLTFKPISKSLPSRLQTLSKTIKDSPQVPPERKFRFVLARNVPRLKHRYAWRPGSQ